MKTAPTDTVAFQEVLQRKQGELADVLRTRDGISIEKSADQMDEIQYASEPHPAIRNVGRDSTLLRQVKAALRRIEDRSFGICIECDSAIAEKRLVVLPWESRCIECQQVADRRGQERSDGTELLVNAA